MGINRNIVECKEKLFVVSCKCSGVLIETLWNVKEMEALINRCANIVLIETLWNVKTETTEPPASGEDVLIETLWNVKSHECSLMFRLNKY